MIGWQLAVLSGQFAGAVGERRFQFAGLSWQLAVFSLQLAVDSMQLTV